MEIQNSEYWRNRKIDDAYRDWKTDSPNWIEEYWKSKNHPHRKQIINILRKLKPWDSLLEIGCNCGVNLANIRKKFGSVRLGGIDANEEAIEFAKKKLPDVNLIHFNIEALTAGNWGYHVDCCLCDAVLMYVSDNDIRKVMKAITQSTKKAIILCEWYDNDKLGVIKGGHWARNYPELLKDFGWETKVKKIIWPTSTKWQEHGKIFISRPALKTGGAK